MNDNLIGVWYRIEGDKRFQRLNAHTILNGTKLAGRFDTHKIFRGIMIVGQYGWLDVDGYSLCFDPKKYICVWWRDSYGTFHRDGWFP